MLQDQQGYNELLASTLEKFPYDEPNKQQLQIMRKCAQMSEKNILMINSSTGSGKTAASLAALMSRRLPNQKIVILTRTISQMEPILREWARIVGGYEAVKNLETPRIMPILGKARLCKLLPKLQQKQEFPASGVNILCKSADCKLYPKNIFVQRKARYILEKMNFTIAGQGMNTTPSLKKVYAIYDKQEKCGYYEQRGILSDATIVVATYPYIRDPLLSSLLKQMRVKMENTLFLIDEAHNLEKPSTLEVMKTDIEFVISVVGRRKILLNLIDLMESPCKITADEIASNEEWLNITSMISSMKKEERIRRNISLRELSRQETLRVLSFFQARNTGFILVKRDRLIIIQATPSKILQPLIKSTFTIFQSGTFDPIIEFKKLFALPAETLITEGEKINNKFGCYLHSGLTSAYKRRKPSLYRRMVDMIINLYEISPRHVLLICPSYTFLQEMYAQLKIYEEENWIGELSIINGEAESRLVLEDKKIDTEQIIKSLGVNEKKIIVAVSNGKLSEGVEVVKNGKSLISLTIFAGLPFIPPSTDTFIMKKARNIASGNPTAVKQFEQNIPLAMMVQQAFGRSTRTSKDRGAMVILDYRAERYLYKALNLRRYKSKDYMLNDIVKFFTGYSKLENL